MPRGIVLSPEVERIIGDVYMKHPELRTKPKRFHEEVSRQIHEKIDWAPTGWPGPSVVNKRLAKLRQNDMNRPPESTELDEAWSIGSLSRYCIPPEALSAVMKVYEEEDPWGYFTGPDDKPFTIREALWVARLYKIIDNPDLLLDWAYQYAVEERYSEITGEPLNTVDLDFFLLNVPQEMVKGSRSNRELASYYYYGESSNMDETKKNVIKKGRENERKHKAEG